nr:peamaclein [Ipomoea batatas]
MNPNEEERESSVLNPRLQRGQHSIQNMLQHHPDQGFPESMASSVPSSGFLSFTYTKQNISSWIGAEEISLIRSQTVPLDRLYPFAADEELPSWYSNIGNGHRNCPTEVPCLAFLMPVAAIALVFTSPSPTFTFIPELLFLVSLDEEVGLEDKEKRRERYARYKKIGELVFCCCAVLQLAASRTDSGATTTQLFLQYLRKMPINFMAVSLKVGNILLILVRIVSNLREECLHIAPVIWALTIAPYFKCEVLFYYQSCCTKKHIERNLVPLEKRIDVDMDLLLLVRIQGSEMGSARRCSRGDGDQGFADWFKDGSLAFWRHNLEPGGKARERLYILGLEKHVKLAHLIVGPFSVKARCSYSRQKIEMEKMMSIRVALRCVLMMGSILMSWSLAERSTVVEGSSFCDSKCAVRCSKSGRPDRYLKYCGICCDKCHCVPSGTFGHKDECPCYRDMKNSKGGPNCP